MINEASGTGRRAPAERVSVGGIRNGVFKNQTQTDFIRTARRWHRSGEHDQPVHPFGHPSFSPCHPRASTLYSRQPPLLRSRSITATALSFSHDSCSDICRSRHTLLENRRERSPPAGVEERKDADGERGEGGRWWWNEGGW